MSAFEALQKYYSSPGNMGAPRATMREESAANPAHVVDGELVHSGRPVENAVEKDDMSEMKETLADEPTPEELRSGIERKNASQHMSKMQILSKFMIEKVTSGGSTVATRGQTPGSRPEIAGPAWVEFYKDYPELEAEGDVYAQNHPNYKAGMSEKSHGTPYYAHFMRLYNWIEGGRSGERPGKPGKAKRSEGKSKTSAGPTMKSIEKAHVSPALARLLAAAAGWALSGDVGGKVDPHLAQEWDRATSNRDKKRLQEEMMSQMHRMHRKPQAKLMIIHRKSDDGNFLDDSPAFGDLHMFYKDHAPIPPRYGLMWDAVKHRWTRPEKIGRTVWEVQGKKRFRGTGTGAHERGRRTGGSGGYGVGSAEAGRRFRSVGDVGRLHPHEAKHPGQKVLHTFGKVRKLPKRR